MMTNRRINAISYGSVNHSGGGLKIKRTIKWLVLLG
jgi:aspartyl/asparaginyl-tRNA synthetase